jgi:hypothetical protein
MDASDGDVIEDLSESVAASEVREFLALLFGEETN